MSIPRLAKAAGSLGLAAFAVAFLALSATAQQRPELVAQTGHSFLVFALDFSPDMRLMATGSEDSTVKLWDVASGRELRTLAGHRDAVYDVAFSPDGRLLASASGDYTIRIWEVATGKEVRKLVHPAGEKKRSDAADEVSGSFPALAFLADNRTIVSGGADGHLRRWDVKIGRQTSDVAAHDEDVRDIAATPDGKVVVTTGADGSTKIWRGREAREVANTHDVLTSPYAAAITADGRLAATGGFDNLVHLWETATGKEIHTLAGHTDVVKALVFDEKAGILVSGSGDQRVKFWEIATGNEVKELTASNTVTALALTRDSTKLGIGVGNFMTTIWDVPGWRELHTMRRIAPAVDSLALSQNAQTLASARGDGRMAFWSMSRGVGFRSVDTKYFNPKVAASADGRLVAASLNKSVEVWGPLGTKLSTYRGAPSSIQSLALNADATRLAAGCSSKEVVVWDVATGTLVRTFPPEGDWYPSAVAFTPDGKTLAVGDGTGPIQLRDLASGQTTATLTGHASYLQTVVFSPDGRIAASGDASGVLYVWDVATGRAIHKIEAHDWIESVAFSPDGASIATGGWDRAVRLWGVASGKLLREMKGHTEIVATVAFTPDGRTLVSAAKDGTIRLWNAGDGAHVATLFAIGDDWLVATPDGLFDGSPGAWQRVLWRFGDTFDVAPVELFFNEYFHPNLLAELLAGERPRAPSDIAKKDRRPPAVEIAVDGAATEISSRMAKVAIRIPSAPAGATDLRLFRNGSLVRAWRGDTRADKKPFSVTAEVPVVAGENRFTAYAFNRDGIKSEDASATVTGAASLARKGTAWVIAVGINDYANDAFDLRYAVPDADLFAEKLARLQTSLGLYSRVEVVRLSDREATKANILAAIARLGGAPLPASAPAALAPLATAAPEDAVFVYFSGHGMALDERFYLVPHDIGFAGSRDEVGAHTREIASHGVSDRELEAALEPIDAGSLLLVIDACQSGQVLEAAERRRGPMNSKGLAQLAYEKGMMILTAAQSYQSAVATAKLGHGYLTYALVSEGLEGSRADSEPNDGRIEAREWLDWTVARVPEMQEGPDEKRLLVQESEQTGRAVQRPRAFYRSETAARPLVVARATRR